MIYEAVIIPINMCWSAIGCGSRGTMSKKMETRCCQDLSLETAPAPSFRLAIAVACSLAGVQGPVFGDASRVFTTPLAP